jgi:CRISPR-associated endoribonuclease Cas6
LRLILALRSTRSSPYDLCYHRNLQGFIYSLIRKAGYLDLHDKPGCKFFSFSNLIPPGRSIEAGAKKAFVVSSPDREMIASLEDEARGITGEEIRIGDMTFRLLGSKTIERGVPGGFGEFVLESGTPIVVRIPQYRLKEYGIETARDYDYVYWRKDHTPTPFIKQLEENLIKKYGEYSGTETDETPIFEKVRFLKQVAVPLHIDQRETTIIGTLWEFYLRALDERKRDLLQFGLDAGFGEMNSLGFGFMNLRTSDPEVALN